MINEPWPGVLAGLVGSCRHISIQTGQLDHQLFEPAVIVVFAELFFLVPQRGDR